MSRVRQETGCVGRAVVLLVHWCCLATVVLAVVQFGMHWAWGVFIALALEVALLVVMHRIPSGSDRPA